MGASRAATLFGFFILPIISMGAALVSIPVLISTGGTSAWASVAVAQGVGATAALLVTFGWGTVGPAQVARSDTNEQRHIYWLSVVMRSLLVAIVLPMVVGITVWLASPDRAILAVAVCVAVLLQGMSPGWFLIGQSRPLAIAAMETGPRAAAQLVSVAAVVATRDLLWYGLILLVSEVAIAAVSAAILCVRDPSKGPAPQQVINSARQQWPLALSALVGSGYTRAAVPIVSAVAYPAVAVYASLDRVQLLARTGIRPLISFFQGWVVRENSRRRSQIATAVTIGAGIGAGMGVALLLPVFDYLIFTEAISVTSTQASLVGIAIISVSASYSTGLYYLVPRGAIKVLSSSSIVGSLVGIPMLVFFTGEYGATGAVLAIAAAETLVVVWHLGYLVIAKKDA